MHTCLTQEQGIRKNNKQYLLRVTVSMREQVKQALDLVEDGFEYAIDSLAPVYVEFGESRGLRN